MVVISKRVDSYLALMGVCSAFVLLYLFGIHGFLRSAPFGLDFGVFHHAATMMLNGGNPWLDSVAGEPFSYPPHTASLLLVYGFFSESTALAFHTGVNVFSIGVIAQLANFWYLKIGSLRSMSMAQGVGLAVLIGNPFMAHILYEGQLALPAAAAVFASWHFLQREKLILAGILLGLSTIKPQVSLLYICWLLVSLNFRVLFMGGMTAVVMLLPAFAMYGPIDAFLHWFASMRGYSEVPANIPGSAHVVGIESFFAAMGVKDTGWFIKPLSLVALGMLYWYREQIPPVLTVNIFLVIALTFIYGHDTDYAIIVMLWSMLLFLAFEKGGLWPLAIAGVLTLGFFFPQRILRAIDIPALHHTRTWLIPLCCYFVYLWLPVVNKASSAVRSSTREEAVSL